ncbi:MAG: RNase adapter RapZ [Pseudomonadota bacterium]
MSNSAQMSPNLIVVSGPSGAGRSTAINVLEDLGFEAIDNVPLSLLPRLTDGALPRPLAVGIDVRNRDFSVDAVLEVLDRWRGRPDLETQFLFLEASEDVLVRRYSETRRRHPLSPEEPAIQGIRREAELLRPLRDSAEILLDTSDLSPHDLKAALTEWFGEEGGGLFGVSLQSFSYKRGLPKGIDMAFDCRFLRNPYWNPDLRGLTGLNPEVAAHIEEDTRATPFIEATTDMLKMLLPAFKEEGKSHLSVGFGCTGGQHRSVYVTEQVAMALAQQGWRVSKRHREQERADHSASRPITP